MYDAVPMGTILACTRCEFGQELAMIAGEVGFANMELVAEVAGPVGALVPFAV